MSTPKPIRDPVYNYIHITPIEKSIIDTPDFQRLRYILQNSTAHLTYPNANNCRFLHSLGTMHLAGKMFQNALSNAKTSDLNEFLELMHQFMLPEIDKLRVTKEKLISDWLNSIGNTCQLSNEINPDSVDSTTFDYDPNFIVNTIWQVARIAGLTHDLGHLPMSHLFENAIKSFEHSYNNISQEFREERTQNFKKHCERVHDREYKELTSQSTPAIHEMNGLLMFSNFTFDNSPYSTLVTNLASIVLTFDSDIKEDANESDLNKSIRCIHGLVSGEIDADRLDYCVRDPQASAMELGAIDIERICANMVLCKNEERQFMIIPSCKAISAVEAFFHQRYLLYKYEIYHHNVVRFDGLLEKILVWILAHAYSPHPLFPIINDLLDKVSFVRKVTNNGVESKKFMDREYSAIYDDCWLRSILSEILILIKKNGSNTKESNKICLMLETYLYRRTENIFSFWKRDSEIYSHLNTIDPDILINGNSPFSIQNKGPLIKKEFDSFIANLENSLSDDSVLIVKSLKHKIHKPNDLSSSILNISNKSTSIVRVESISPYIKSLNESIVNVPDIHLSVVSKDIKNNQKVLNSAESAFNELSSNYIRKVIEDMI